MDSSRDTFPAAETRPFAAVDIGSNQIRMAVAQIHGDGSLEIIDRYHQSVRLGQDVFRRGTISRQRMRLAASVLRAYRRRLDFYGVGGVRAVATSAVREASNRDVFVDRVFMASGLDVEIITTAEESRLSVWALQEASGPASKHWDGKTLIADVGAGSTLLTYLDQGEIISSRSLRLGGARLQEAFGSEGESASEIAELQRNEIDAAISRMPGDPFLPEMERVIAIGGPACLAADHLRSNRGKHGFLSVKRKDLNTLLDQLQTMPLQKLARRFAMTETEVETLVPSLLVFQQLLGVTNAQRMQVSDVTMIDGLLLDMAHRCGGPDDQAFIDAVTHSAESLARKFMADLKHGEQVGRIATRMFDALADEHGLRSRHRLLLETAARLHEVGAFISSRAFHKHSCYIILNAELFGLSQDEQTIVAHVARYHRRAVPKPAHDLYMALPRRVRMIINKLSALLRIADALDNGRTGLVRDFDITASDDDVVIRVYGAGDLNFERRSLAAKADMFRDVYCMNVRLEEAQVREPIEAVTKQKVDQEKSLEIEELAEVISEDTEPISAQPDE